MRSLSLVKEKKDPLQEAHEKIATLSDEEMSRIVKIIVKGLVRIEGRGKKSRI